MKHITGNEIDIAERIKSNLDRQLTEIRKNHKETYYKTHFDKITDSSLKSQNSNLDINACEKIICDFKIDTNNSINYNHKEVNNIKRKNVKKVKKKSILILGDSMINGIEESKLSKSRHIRVQPISGAKVDDIRDNLDIVINDDLETVVLQIGTNDSTTNSAQDIFNNIMSLKKDIESMLPNGRVVIRKLIKRKDNSDANQINEEVNQLINMENVIQIDNNNINENHLGKRGLHLNDKGNAILAGNILKKLRDLY